MQAALSKLPLTDEQVIAAAESPNAKVFENTEYMDDALALYERYRKLKSKEMSWADKWSKAKDVASEIPSVLGVIRDEIINGFSSAAEEDADLAKYARTGLEGAMRGTDDLFRVISPFVTWLRAENTYEDYLAKTGKEQNSQSRKDYNETLKGDFADFMMLRNWDTSRESVRRGETTFIDRWGLTDYIGNDINNKLAESLSYVADPFVVAGGASVAIKGGGRLSMKIAQKLAAKGGVTTSGRLAELGGKGMAGVGSVVRGTGELPEKAAAAVAGEAAGGTVSAGTTAATVMGAGTTPVTVAKFGGAATEKVGETISDIGSATARTPLPGGGFAEEVSKARGKSPGWLSPYVSKAGRTTLAGAKGAAAGGAVGGVLASGEALREKDIIETAIPGLAIGSVLGGMTATGIQGFREVSGLEFRSQVKRNTAAWKADKGEVEIKRLEEAGLKDKDFDRLALVERIVGGLGGDDVRFAYLTDEEFKALSGGRAQGAFMYEGIDGKPTVGVNLERSKDPNRTIYHEIGHALDMLDFAPEARRTFDDAMFGKVMDDGTVIKKGLIDDDQIPKLAEQYGIGLLDLDSDPTIARRQMRDRIAGELRAEAWANMLSGSKIKKLGATGVTSRITDGIMLMDADSRLTRLMQKLVPGSRSGSEGIFTLNGKDLYNTPEMNKLLTAMFRAKRRINETVTLQDAGTSTRNIITQKDFNKKNGQKLAEVFADADVFARDSNGEILNQRMQPISKHGGAPKFLTKTQLRESRKKRAAAIHEALNKVESPTGSAMDRLPFRIFSDPVARDKFKANGLGAFFSEAQMNALRSIDKTILPPGLLAKLEVLNKAAQEGGGQQFAIMYNAALKDTGRYSASLSNEYRQGVVLDFELTTAGNLNVRTLDMIGLHNRVDKMIKHFGKNSKEWDAWGGYEKAFEDGTFMDGFFQYLGNHKRRAAGDESIKGHTGLHTDEFKAKRMRDIYNEVIGWRGREEANPLAGTIFKERDNAIKSRRLDRINEIFELEGQPNVFINQNLQRHNLMPDNTVVNDVSQLGDGVTGRTKFEDKAHPKNEAQVQLPDGTTTHSRTRPSRDQLGEQQSSQIPKHLRFANVNQMLSFVDRSVDWLRERMDQLYTPGEKWFYEKMYLAGARLAGDDASKADLYIRMLAYLSPRTAVPANFTKSFGAGISPFMTGIAAGNKAGSFKQVQAISQIISEWHAGEAFGSRVAGVDNKVENFYLNGMAEMIRDFGVQGKEIPDAILQDPRFRDPVELSRLSTNDMWHMAAMADIDPQGGNVWPGFVLKVDKGKLTGFAWSDTREGRRVSLDSAEGKKVMKHLAIKGENGSKTPDPKFGVTDLTKQELKALDYRADDNSVMVFDEKTDAGLNAKGEGPLYDHVQMITGLIADQINAEGGIAGRKTVDAYNIQELMWAAIKMDNPLKGMRDYESYLAPVDEFIKFVESGLEGEMPKSIEAATNNYNRWAKQLVSGEIDTWQQSGWAEQLKASRDRLAAEGVQDPDNVIVNAIADGLPAKLEEIALTQGLDARVDSVRTDIGAYMGDNNVVETNWAIYIQGRGKDFGKLDNMVRGAAAQQGGNHIRPLKVEERSLVAKLEQNPSHPAPKGFNENLSVVLEIGGAANMSPDAVKALVADLTQLKDSKGNSFMTGLSKIDDSIVIHDGYYRGEWQSDGSFKRYSIFDKKAPKFGDEIDNNIDVLSDILQNYGLTMNGTETKIIRAESNPYIKSGKDTIQPRSTLRKPARSGKKDQRQVETERDVQGVSFLRGYFSDASKSAAPGQGQVRYDADQLGQIRKAISANLPKPGTKIPKANEAQLRQLGSDAGVLSAVANSKLLPGQIDTAIAGKVFDSVMALAEKQPAKFLKSYDKRFVDIQTPYLKRMLKEGVKEFAAESVKDKQKRAKTLSQIDKALKKSPTPAQKQKRKTQLESQSKRIAENDAIIDKALGDKIISEAQAGSLRNRIGSGQKLMPDTGGGKRRTVSGSRDFSTSDSFKPTENVGALAVFANELGYRVMHSAGGKFRLYDTSGALLGIAASKEAVAKLYRRKVLAKKR